MLASLRGYKREIGLLKHVDSLIVLRKGRRQRPIGIFFVSFVLGSCRVYSPPTPPMSLKCPSTVSRELQSHHLISHSSCLCHLVAIIEASAIRLLAPYRVAEVAREHGWHPPKSLDSDENFKPEHTLFCRELRFVAIYALFFGDLWA